MYYLLGDINANFYSASIHTKEETTHAGYAFRYPNEEGINYESNSRSARA